MLKKIYVAGNYRGITPWRVYCNIHNAKMWGLEVAKLGANPLVPHANTGFYDGELPDQFWLDADIEWLRLCDAVFVCPGSGDSIGVANEIAEAEKLGIPVFNTLKGVARWLCEQE